MTLSGRIIPVFIVPLGACLGTLLMLPAVAMAAGMPQLDFNTPLTVSQVVWGAIIFAVLYVLLSRTGLPMVASVLDERAAHIGHDLEGARAAKTSADNDIAEADAATAKARAEAQAAIAAALDEAKKIAATQSEALNARLEARLQEAETQISQARTAAMGALRQVATETAVDVVTRLTGSAPDRANVDSAIDTALAARAG
jgi:F-type H+-transporting ATPase subunit b